MPFTSSSIHGTVDAALAQLRARGLELSTFTTSIDASPPPTTIAPSRGSKYCGPSVGGSVKWLNQNHERVLVDEAAPDVRVGALDRERAVAPGAAGEHDRREAPVVRQLAEVDVAADAW